MMPSAGCRSGSAPWCWRPAPPSSTRPSWTSSLIAKNPMWSPAWNTSASCRRPAPPGGLLKRPSDGARTAKIAWIQCVGSRGLQKGGATYCSSACCMFALKEAMSPRSASRTASTPRFSSWTCAPRQRLRGVLPSQPGRIRACAFVRSRPHSVDPKSRNDRLTIAYLPHDGDAMQEEGFDMVVLATGFRISEAMFKSPGQAGRRAQRPTVLPRPPASTGGHLPAGGLCLRHLRKPQGHPRNHGPGQRRGLPCAGMHIPDTAPDAGTVSRTTPRTDVSAEGPGRRVHLRLRREHRRGRRCGRSGPCGDAARCGRIRGGGPRVQPPAMERIVAVIAAENINRVVIGGCSPRTHEIRFQETLAAAGLNKYLLEIANLRDQDTWVHLDQPEKATGKARDLVAWPLAAVSRARPLQDQHPAHQPRRSGGGRRGDRHDVPPCGWPIRAFKVFLAERMSMLGGVASAGPAHHRGRDDVQAFVRPDRRDDGPPQHPGHHQCGHRRPQRHAGDVQNRHAGGAPDVLPPDQPRGDHHGHRGAAQPAVRQYLLDEHGGHDPAGCRRLLETRRKRVVRSWDNVVMIQCVGPARRTTPTARGSAARRR
jgi:heterodisulfide reductase subunit A